MATPKGVSAPGFLVALAGVVEVSLSPLASAPDHVTSFFGNVLLGHGIISVTRRSLCRCPFNPGHFPSVFFRLVTSSAEFLRCLVVHSCVWALTGEAGDFIQGLSAVPPAVAPLLCTPGSCPAPDIASFHFSVLTGIVP